jgi:hypothetical protein
LRGGAHPRRRKRAFVTYDNEVSKCEGREVGRGRDLGHGSSTRRRLGMRALPRRILLYLRR